MTGQPSEKIDPAHWVSIAAGAVMMAVVLLCSVALWAPWWTDTQETPGQTGRTEVGLWTRYTKMEMEADDTTLNCAEQCDFTKIGSAKVRESNVPWADVCVEATDVMADNCTRIWVVRLFTLFCWFSALLYAAFSTLNFCGAGFPSAVRIPALAKLVLAFSCVISCALAVSIASSMEIRLTPTVPGTEPREKPTVQPVGLNGIGFLSVLASLILSIVGVGMAYLTQFVVDHLESLADIERGRELCNINQGKSPSLHHQVGAAVGKAKHVDTTQVAPEPEAAYPPLGSWMN